MTTKKHKNLRSEYSNSYKFDEKTAEDNYAENLRLRLARRNQEVCHQPWLWGDSEDSDVLEESDCKSNNKEERNKVGKNCTTKANLKEEAVQVNENEMGNKSEQCDSDFDGSRSINLDNSHSKILHELKMKAFQRAKEMRENVKENRKPEPQTREAQTAQSSSNNCQRPQHPLKGARVQKRDIKSAPIKPKLSTKEPFKCGKADDTQRANKNQDNSSCFMFYGNGTPGSGEFNRKQTFNVNSKVDVYQSALRASNQRQHDHQLRSNRQSRNGQPIKSALGPRFVGRGNKMSTNRNIRSNCSSKSISCDEAAKAMAGKRFRHRKMKNRNNDGDDEYDDDDNDDWHSEYQLQYPIYDNEIYRRCRANIAERGVSARIDTPRTCRI